jgi:hypothetical protein
MAHRKFPHRRRLSQPFSHRSPRSRTALTSPLSRQPGRGQESTPASHLHAHLAAVRAPTTSRHARRGQRLVPPGILNCREADAERLMESRPTLYGVVMSVPSGSLIIVGGGPVCMHIYLLLPVGGGVLHPPSTTVTGPDGSGLGSLAGEGLSPGESRPLLGDLCSFCAHAPANPTVTASDRHPCKATLAADVRCSDRNIPSSS